MSDLNQIHAALNRLFDEEGQRIVFWNDPDREFSMTLPLLELDGVTTLRLDEVGALEVKIRLERTDPKGKFLLYAPTEEPDYEDDWLLDIRLYSRSFRADKASILLQELGLVNPSLRTHVADRRKFFDAKDRLQRIKALVAPDDAAGDLDRKMIAVVARADQPELFNLVRTIFHAWTDAGADLDLDSPPGRHAHRRNGRERGAPGPVPPGDAGDGGQRVVEDIGPRLELGGEGRGQGRLRLLQGQRPPGQRLDEAWGPRLPPARSTTSSPSSM